MSPSQYQKMMAILNTRLEAAATKPAILDHSSVFPQQRGFIEDPARLKALFCTRRSAKSFTSGLYLLYEALRTPGCNCLFIGLTRDSAKGIIWKDVLKVLDRLHGIKAKPNLTDLTLTLPNGSVIAVTGVDAEQDEMMKLLGRKYRLVCIDEASMYTVDLRNLVYGVLKPAMADERGTIALMGTASNFPRGLFYDVTTGSEGGWKKFEWTAHDNPHVAKQWQEELDEIRTNRPLYMDTPQFKQWYLNQWVVDEEKLCYRFRAERNLISIAEWEAIQARLNPEHWAKVLGGDTGWEDDNALVKTVYHLNDPNLYIPTSFAQAKMTFDQFAQKIVKDFPDAQRIIIDGANKQGVESMKARYQIPFEYADKIDKVTHIELMNADLTQGRLKIVDTPENRPLIDEMMSLVWVTDGDKIKLPKKEHPSLPNHRCDALLYAWRNGYHYHVTPLEKKAVYGSKEWYIEQSENIWEKEREALEKEGQRGDWPSEADGW